MEKETLSKYTEIYILGSVGFVLVDEPINEVLARIELSSSTEFMRFKMEGGGIAYAKSKDIKFLAESR
jgi:hypothetical protein